MYYSSFNKFRFTGQRKLVLLQHKFLGTLVYFHLNFLFVPSFIFKIQTSSISQSSLIFGATSIRMGYLILSYIYFFQSFFTMFIYAVLRESRSEFIFGNALSSIGENFANCLFRQLKY